jgi:hypothetical protein
MFHEYAMDPAVLRSWERVRYFLDAFVPWKGRFLAEYPRRWRRMVYENLARTTVRPVEKARIEERLRRLDRRVLLTRCGAPYDPARSWLDNAECEHARRAFRAIIANEARCNPAVLDAETLDERTGLWNVEQGTLVSREPAAIAGALALLLRCSSHVTVIDPYFRGHHSDKADALAAICEMVRVPGAKVEVHAGLNEEDPALEWLADQTARFLPPRLPAGLRVTVRCWKVPGEGLRLHNRYILTDVAGVKFGDSIERGADGQEDHVSILDESSRARLWAQYVEAPVFEPAGPSFEVVGRRTRCGLGAGRGD